MRIAVIDLGTNTCNLLIAEIRAGKFSILNQSKQLVKLGDSRIKANEIGWEATARVLSGLAAHKKLIDRFGVETVKVIATSAVRSAANKIEFLKKITSTTGWEIDVITGEREADLIFKGVLLAFGKLEQPVAILDIGGGSNEIILGSGTEIEWKESRATGMSRVINQFLISDPVLPEEINVLRDYFEKEHGGAFKKIKHLGIKKLIGCSGSFDTVADILERVNPGEKQRTMKDISLNHFYEVYNVLIGSTRNERIKLRGMDMVRVDLIVPAVIFIEQMLAQTGITQVVQTDYALREGVLYELLAKE